MAAVEPLFPRANATWCAVDGAITIVAADDPVELALRRDRVAKRARDQDLREEADARGWSSAISERGLALRRRSRPAPSSLTGATTMEMEEHACPQELAPDEPEAKNVSHSEHEAQDMRLVCSEHFFISIL